MEIGFCLAAYQEKVCAEQLVSDDEQLTVCKKLDALSQQIIEDKKSKRFFKSFFALTGSKSSQFFNYSGLYLYGGVGTGKSMLMDLFFECLTVRKKTRVHFHKFMQDTHLSINYARSKGSSDPISEVASRIAQQTSVLCFDELQITDIADAMIVGRLFARLLELNTYLVITSNRPPDELYQDGLNRKVFIPFIELLKDATDVVFLKTTKDYRREKIVGHEVYLSPINRETQNLFNSLSDSLLGEVAAPMEIFFNKRVLFIKNYYRGVGRVDFSDLCGKPLGTKDYLELCKHIRVLLIDNIPILNERGMDSAKRFVTLVDTLYEARIKVIFLAEDIPEKLYTKGRGSFEFQRTISRLYEMQSDDWVN